MTLDKQSIKSVYCRICHEDGNTGELIDPCECSGTVGAIHTKCLEKWLSTSNSAQCEICNYAYSIQKKNKPFTQSICLWWSAKSGFGPQGVAGDVICFVVLTPLCIAATYLCAIGASAYTRSGFWEGTGLAVLCCMLVATYCLWLIVTMRFHFKSWKSWCRHNQDVELLVKHRDISDKIGKISDNQGIQENNNNNNNNNNNIFNTINYDNVSSGNSWFTGLFNGFEDPPDNLEQTTMV